MYKHPRLIVAVLMEHNQIFAGTDTVGNALHVGLAHLIRRPKLLDRVFLEVQSVWPSINSPPPGLSVLESLPLLHGVFKESVRHSQGVPIPLWRVACEDSIVDSVPVPKGTQVGIAAPVIQLNPRYFPDPEAFDPNRWDDSKHSPETLALRDDAFVSFSKGARICVGRYLAQAELLVGFAVLVRKLKFQIEEAQEEQPMKELLSSRAFITTSYPGGKKNSNGHWILSADA